MKLGQRLADLRKAKHLSQEDLAEKLYVSRQTISNWERDKTYPDINSLLLIATFFDISLDNLIKGDVAVMKHKHQLEQAQFKKWLAVTGLAFFTYSFIQPLGRFYPIANFKLVSSLFFLPLACCLYKLYRFMKNHELSTYSQILAFINGKEKQEFSWSRELGLTFLTILLIFSLIILGQFLGTILFY